MFGYWRRAFRARTRAWGSFALMIAVLVLLPASLAWPTRLMLAWNTGVLLYVVLVLHLAFSEDSADIRRRAERDDDGAVVVLIITCMAALVSVGAIGYEFADAANDLGPVWRIALAVATIILSWMMVHASFATHYAHEHYGPDERRSRGGLKFPTEDEAEGYDPDYWDFFYFSANLGAAAQTSDVQITSRTVRRIVLAHTIVAFLFNTMILALGVNLAASVIEG